MDLIKVLKSIVGINLLNELQYKGDFFIQFISVLLDFVLAILTVDIMFSQISALNQWNKVDILVLVGMYRIFVGIINVFTIPSLSALPGSVISGDFDYVLLTPVDSQFFTSMKEVRAWKLSDVILGLIFIIYIYATNELSFSLSNLIGALLMLICGGIIVACFYSIIASLSFWFNDVSNLLIIIPQCFEWAGKWPVTIFPGFLRILFTFLIPVGVAITLPTQALLNSINSSDVALTVGFCLLLILLSRIIWKMGVKRYSGASS
ncbi:ABC transporter permease [Paenibacillus albidus]|uniref:ABC transporter permease n=1 Tax=Paenibacillus albidus TaxID=2041023 RepID=A0A917FWD7_9BACL|nr:ABC-2 family transporter protein [Paenibacillus albidus]GGG07099.1 ABC transporter permease [Paenibacillus albidus]